MTEACGNRHIDTAMDRMDPGRTGERYDDAGGSQDAEAAHNAQARIPGLLCQLRAARHGNLDLDIRRLAIEGGMVTLRVDGWLRACEGVTTIEEVLRVTQEDA